MRHCLWVLLAILALTSQALAGSTADATGTSEPAAMESVQTAAPAVPQVYRISSGDLLSITTWGDDRFTLDCQVNGRGSISFPELGDVPVAGMTCGEAKDRLEQGPARLSQAPSRGGRDQAVWRAWDQRLCPGRSRQARGVPDRQHWRRDGGAGGRGRYHPQRQRPDHCPQGPYGRVSHHRFGEGGLDHQAQPRSGT